MASNDNETITTTNEVQKKNRKKFEEKIEKNVEKQFAVLSANMSDKIASDVTERVENQIIKSVSVINSAIDELKTTSGNSGASGSRSGAVLKGSSFKAKNRILNQSKGKNSYPKIQPKDEFDYDNPELYKRHDGEPRLEWVRRLFREIGYDGKAFNHIIENVIMIVKKDMNTMSMEPIVINDKTEIRSCIYFQSNNCKQNCFDSLHLDRNATKNGRAYAHICKLCLTLCGIGIEHPIKKCMILSDMDKFEMDKTYAPMLICQIPDFEQQLIDYDQMLKQ